VRGGRNPIPPRRKNECLFSMKSWRRTSPTSRASATRGVGPATGSTVRNPDVHGRASRSGEVRRPLRRGRARDPKRWRSRERRRDPFSRHFLQAPRNERMVRHPPQRLRHGVLHRRKYRGLLSKSLETASLGPDGSSTWGRDPVPTKARLSTGSRSQTRSAPSLRTSSAFVVTPGSERYCDLRIRLRRSKWRARGGARGDESRRGEITRTIALAADWRPIAELRRWI